jgi:hypothetical protein
MAKCTALTRGEEPCKGLAIDSYGLCFAHHPNHAAARQRAARKAGRRGGRGRPVAEVAGIKQRLSGLAESVLAGEVDRADAAVVSQVLNVYLRAVSVELKVREVEELETCLSELEEMLTQRDAHSARRAAIG